MVNKSPKTAITLFPALGEAAVFCLLSLAQSAVANPQGGVVAVGNASIDNTGTTTTIVQTSTKAIINWQDFSVEENQLTEFIQPSAQSMTLNRVVGDNSSQIMGRLKSNGQIYLINPNGILFGKTAQVDVGGLVVSTSPIADADFMNERLQKFGASQPHVGIINEGSITVRNAGIAVLVSPIVVNSGVIEANVGKVTIGASDHFTIDLYGDNLITFDATSSMGSSLLKNEGKISANGGAIYLTARAADNMLETVIQMDGYIEAKTVSNQNGKVVLEGPRNGKVSVSGTINVAGNENGQTGGLIQITSGYVYLGSDSLIEASGYAGGGTVHIGSDVFQPLINSGTLPRAQYVFADVNSQISAKSIYAGNGGNVVVWADNATWFYGGINAAATGTAGDGGKVETSGHYLNVSGIQVNTSSVGGQSGIWLLDPYNISIENGTSPINYFSGGNPNTFNPTATAIIGVTDINNNLANANVIITTGVGGADAGDIAFNNTTPINWGNSNSFTLLAARDILFNHNNAINKSSGSGVIYLRSDSDSNGTGIVNFNANTITSTGPVNIYYNPTNFSTPISYAGSVTASPLTSYMLVHDNVSGRALSDVNLNATTRAQTYALSQNISTGLSGLTNAVITSFTGKMTGANYTGVNYTISGLNITGSASSAGIGLFGTTSGGATLDNLTLVNPVVSGNTQVGALVGQATDTQITGSILISGGSVTGTGVTAIDTGGVIGKMMTTAGNASSITASMSSSASVTGVSNIGGLIGHVVGLVNGLVVISGANDFTITGNASIKGRTSVGGLIGLLSHYTVFNRTGNVSSASTVLINPSLTAAGTNIGGLFGSISGSISSTSDFNPSTLINNATVNPNTTTGSITGIGGAIGTFSKIGLTVSTDFTNHGLIYAGNIASSTVYVGGVSMGGIAGQITGDSTFTGAFYADANVIGGNAVGGLIGSFSKGTLSGGANFIYASNGGNRTVQGNSLAGASGVGGLVGRINGGVFVRTGVVMTDISGGGSITVTRPLGGINTGGLFGLIAGTSGLGTIFNPTEVVNYATVLVGNSIDTRGIGGVAGQIVGLDADKRVINTHMTNYGDVNVVNGPATQRHIGGIVGYSDRTNGNPPIYTGIMTNYGNINAGSNGRDVGGVFGHMSLLSQFTGSAINRGDVIGGDRVGGTIGYAGTSVVLNNLVSSGNIYGNSNIGGIIGTMDSGSTLTNVFFSGTINAPSGTPVGGIAGVNGGTISNGLSVGTVVGLSGSVGALVGQNNGQLINSYFDTRKGLSAAVGSGTAGGTGYGTNVEFSNTASYVGFVFPSIWTLSSGYYANLTFCGSGCRVALPVTPSARVLPDMNRALNILQQIQATIQDPYTYTVSWAEMSIRFLSLENLLLSIEVSAPGLTNDIKETLKKAGLKQSIIDSIYIAQQLNTRNVEENNISAEDLMGIADVITDQFRLNSKRER